MAGEWRASTWGDEISLEYGKALRGYDKSQGRYCVFGANGPIGWTSEPLAQGPGVILGRKGANRGVRYSSEPFFVIDTAYYVAPKSELDMRWLYYAVKHHRLGEVDDGSPIPSTTRAAVYMLDLDVPPLPEQRAIAHILGSLDDKIELNRRMNETLEALSRTLFKSWFVDFDPVRAKMEGRQPAGMDDETAALFPDSFEDSALGEIPKGWSAGTVGDDFDIIMGQSPPGETYNEVGEGLPFYQGRRDFKFRYPTLRVYCSAPKRTAQHGDALVSVRAPVGDVNMAENVCCVGRGVAAVRHKTGGRSYTYYAMHSLKSYFERFESEGTVFGAVNKQGFLTIPFLLPPPALVETFESSIFPLDQRIEVQEKQSRTLAEIRDALLPKLLSGEIRVREAEEIVEDIV
jgi:type I restriction enzyme S subunit